MIQRIQSVYLFFSVLLLSVLFFTPYAGYFLISGKNIVLECVGFFVEPGPSLLFSTIPALSLLILTVLINLVTIFMFKNRRLQIRLSIYNLILMLGLFGLLFFYYKMGSGQVNRLLNDEIVTVEMKWTALIPVFSSFLTYLAYKGILKDEILVKSIDRIR